MIPATIQSGILIYEVIQVTVAFMAVALALKWKKTELIAGLSCILIYAILESFDIFLFTINQGIFFDVAQFGFILLALVFFIIGMNPAWAHKEVPETKHPKEKDLSSGSRSVFFHLRKF